jgi:hypothetical protein
MKVMAKSEFLFILGVGRSGTSLLQSMFAAHPSMAYMPESSFLRRYVANGVLAGIYISEGEGGVFRALEEDKSFSRLQVNSLELIRKALTSDELLDLAIYRQMMQMYNVETQPWVGDKDPRLIEFVPLVSSFCPTAKVINIIRDPRDVLLSKKKAAWSRAGHVWKHVFANRVQLKLGCVSGISYFGANYHEVVYEELIAAPEEVLSCLCEAIGLPFDKAMLTFGDAARKLVADNEVSWKKETFGPVLTENKEKWRTGLTPREIVLTELCCKQAFQIGNYLRAARTKKLSLCDRIWVVSGATAIFLLDWPYRLYRNFKVKRACKKII